MESKLISFMMPKKLLARVDNLAEEEARSRSELLREATRLYLNSTELRKQAFDVVRDAARRNDLSEKEAFRLIERVRSKLPMNK